MRVRVWTRILFTTPSCAHLGVEAAGHNQARSRHPRHIVFARPLIVADCNALKQTEDRARGLVQLGVFRSLGQNGPEN